MAKKQRLQMQKKQGNHEVQMNRFARRIQFEIKRGLPGLKHD